MIAFDKSLGRIAIEMPASIPVLEKFGLDYCCAGHRSFEQACRERGLSPEAVAAEIQAAVQRAPEPERDWSLASLTELID
ncbi:MAG: DUF542 domain-containing protein, partial [Armatimonadota bacterium]